MRIPPWRLALTGAAVVILLGAGITFVAASTNTGSQPATAVQAGGSPNVAANPAATSAASPAATPGSNSAGPGIQRLKALVAGRFLRLGLARRVVHVTATVQDKDGNLVEVQLDHGTIQSIASGTITVSEAGGGTVTVSTDGATVVRTGTGKGSLADLKAGDEVFVQSRVDGTATLARHILKVPAGS